MNQQPTDPQYDAVNFHTMRHIETVRNYLNRAAIDLLRRGERHDQSKLRSPEVELFAEYTPKLKDTKYGSAEYQRYLRELAPALDHHYANNAHHPEFHDDGIDGMSLLDLLEMFCDWLASSQRHNTGNVLESIKVNATRFKMSPQLVRVFQNTAAVFRAEETQDEPRD